MASTARGKLVKVVREGSVIALVPAGSDCRFVWSVGEAEAMLPLLVPEVAAAVRAGLAGGKR